MMESCFNDKMARANSIIVEDLRRDLNTDLTEMAHDQEHLQVYLRIRPFSQAELNNGESQDCVTIQPPDTVLLKAPRTSLSARLSDKSVPQTAQRFQFSQVFGPDTSQKDMFDGTVKCLVRDVLEGRNSLVFTYGVTNAGKTFTFLGPETDMGILPRSLNMLFSNLEDRIFTQMSLKPHRCLDFLKLTKEQQAEEAVSKRNLFRLLKESDAQKSMTSLLASRTLEELAELDGSVSEWSLSLDMDLHTKFSVWVSFCEIYNENIHDLLEQPSSNAARRTNLRLCQDIKGNSFIKDLRWVQVNSADEAFKVMKLGKKNQSISSTKLNQLSSRSHSIFSVRILRIEDVGIPRVQSVSELSLCDLAGSERCGKTQNKGDRLKEAGNINTSLLCLGKCINALKGSQQAKHHVPFRESKLTHYLQGYFTGRGRACMIVNINQCASMYDETLNVLKFSAVAQKVVVLTTASILPLVVKRSAREVSFIINKAAQRGSRRTSLLRWERSLEDVKEDTDSEEDEEEEESVMEDTVQDFDGEGNETVLLDKEVYEDQLLLLEELQEKLRTANAENLALESRVREEVTKEFSELFTQIQTDYNDRISKERELVEERCERRLEIFKKLVEKSAGDSNCEGGEEAKVEANESTSLDGMFNSLCCDLAGIRQDAEAAQSCLVTSDSQSALVKKVSELTQQLSDMQKQLALRTQELEAQSRLSTELEEMKKTLESREQKLTDLMSMCVEKDDLNAKVQAELDQAVVDAAKNHATIKDLLQLKHNCTCSESRTKMENRKRRQEGLEELHGQPPLKKGPLDDSSLPEDLNNDSLAEVKGQLECCQLESRQKDEQIKDLEREHQTLEFCIREIKSQLEQEKQSNSKTKQEKERLAAELGALQKSMEEQQQKFLAMENQLGASETNCSNLKTCLEAGSGAKTTGSVEEEELNAIKCRLKEQEHEIEQKNTRIGSLEQEVTQLKEEIGRLREFSSCQECSRLQQESNRKEETVNVLEQQLTEHKAINDNLQRVNSDLQGEVATMNALLTDLREKVKSDQVHQEMEKDKKAKEMAEKETELLAKEEALKKKEAELSHKEAELMSREQLREPESDPQKTEPKGASKEAELALKEAALVEQESQLSALQKSLKQAQERLEEEETQAVQEARRREAERRRELLAVAEEAIAQKDAELLKRQEEINRLKEEMKSNCEKVRSLSVDLQRKEDDSGDLREKLMDSKKQIQQVQKEISSMRDAEKSLKQKLSDLEKAKSQLQNELVNRDRTIQMLKSRSSDSKTEEHAQSNEKMLKDLQARERVIEDMRLALTEQEETQTQLDLELDSREAQIQELSQELENLKEIMMKQRRRDSLPHGDPTLADELARAEEEAAQAKDSLNLAGEKHQAERKKWLEEKLVLIAQAKEAEERRNQDMRRYADDRERHARQHAEMESLTAQLAEREQEMERWRKERDSLVSALEVQLKKLLSLIAEKDKQIQELQCSDHSHAPEEADKGRVEELQALLNEKEAEIQRLEEQLSKLAHTHSTRENQASVRRDSSTQTVTTDDLEMCRPLDSSTLKLKRRTRGSVTSQGSCGSYPSVLDSSEVSTEMGRRSRFPRPEVEIAFSSLQPDRFALKRQGDESAVTVKISRTTRKRKSGEMEKKRGSSRNAKTKPSPAPQAKSQDGVEMENKRNTRCRNTPRLPAHQEEESSPALVKKGSHDSQSSLRGKKERTLQKIGGFLHSSPTFLGSKAKKIMGLMSGKSPDESGSLSLKRNKRKLYRPNISSPMDIPAHQIIGQDPEEKESDHLAIKKRLRARTPK